MGSIIKIVGQEQQFTTANTFSNVTSNTIEGWNAIRIINTSNSSAYVVTVNTNPVANLTVLPLSEIIIEKAGNTAITASNSALLGVLVAFKNN
jgi:hypothetical protein